VTFPTDRAELYRQGIATLLKKWDAKRGVMRDQVYQNLSLSRKKDLLSHIALTTFERKDFFFKKKDF
jgi:predicted NACHT family NTPase